jgi:hypothetical protein
MSDQLEREEPALISIIDGPPPEFYFTEDVMSHELYDATKPYEVARVEMRTMSGPKMIARCRNAWDVQKPVMLEFKDLDGFKQRLEICGARYEELTEGTLLQLWVRMPVELHFVGAAGDDDEVE